MERPGAPKVLVYFRCANPDHARPAAERSDTLTLVEGLWAYCPLNVREPDHRWEATGGVPLETLRR